MFYPTRTSKIFLVLCVAQSQVNPVQHQIDVVRSQMQGITQQIASFRLAYEEAHGPGSSSDLSALGDMATERAKRSIDAGLMWSFMRHVQGERLLLWGVFIYLVHYIRYDVVE